MINLETCSMTQMGRADPMAQPGRETQTG